ncbi:uncharacterized protein PFL1_04808 [Pseudozyma flocculosa PF-1]|uniref:Arrestin-like N-terminal domain-containing protein n=2 Tax=Pseudozyma flocculosa TaxID=84751 RepID=A0A5C3F699_9BASI|nr:uncharacterized protein PFL1_04808 [Pseudozyma flocculosa PF-1]EPQ27670.1 hypothetical protein PFL1_04808 [Pseudozyma flocculosa PF-1]SPO39197.1 uncharacterized protein PSFLO_04676 [Pseudozyma flocculosa]
MLSSIVHHPCEISMHLVSQDIFIHPPPANSEFPGDDKTLRGLVEIKCPSERHIQGIKVVLQGIQTLAIPEGHTGSAAAIRWEEKIIMEKSLEIMNDGSGHPSSSKHSRLSKGKEKEKQQPCGATEGLHLDKGIHGFEFAFIIPASAAPFERNKHGRVRYILTATALGAGRARSHISTWKEIFIMLHVNSDGGPTPLDIQYHDVHEALGPMSVSLTSASLTVGGTANLTIYHPDPPPGLSVHVARVFLEQTFELYSEVRKGWLKLPTEKFRLWEKGYMPYKAKQAEGTTPQDALWIADAGGGAGRPGRGAGGGPANISPFGLPLNGSVSAPVTPGEPATPMYPENGYKIKSVVRLPDDNIIRPSTVRGSRAEIRVSHEMGVEIFFSRQDVLDTREGSESFGLPKVQVFSMRRATMIPSCCCTFDTIHLPPYSLESPSNSRPSSPSPPLSRRSTQAELDHWKRTTPLNLSLPGSRNSSNANSGSSSKTASRETSPTRLGFGHHFGGSHGRKSRNASRDRDRGRSGGGLGNLGLHALTPASSGHIETSGSGHRSGYSTPRSLPLNTPWAVSHLPERTGTSHDTCNCGRTTEELTEAEQRLLEGAPTAPGAWIDSHDENATLPPWTPPSRPGSPVSGWHHGLGGGREGFRPRGKLAEIETPLASPPAS